MISVSYVPIWIRNISRVVISSTQASSCGRKPSSIPPEDGSDRVCYFLPFFPGLFTVFVFSISVP